MKKTNNHPPSIAQNKLKIAILLRRYVITGGQERYAVEVARLLSLEHDVHVFAQEWMEEDNANITFHKIPKVRKPSFINMLVFSYFTKQRLDDSFDIIHSHERVAKFDVLTLHIICFRSFITREKKIWKKIILWLGVLLSPRKIAYLMMEKQQFSYSPSRVLIAVSNRIKQNVQENYPLSDESFSLASPGVSANFATQSLSEQERNTLRLKLGIDQDCLAILFVGTEFKRKGLDGLITGFALVVKQINAKLIIAGGGDPKKYIALTKELGIENDTIFLGLVEDISTIYSISDVFILPTLNEPAGMAPLEAMASGLATIISSAKYSGCAEHIQQGEAVILENPKDPQEIANALMKVNEAAYRQQIALKGQQLAQNITWQKTAENTLSAYYQAISRR